MPTTIRIATIADVPSMVELLLKDAHTREIHNTTLWKLADDAGRRVKDALTFALTAEKQPFRQIWLVADRGGTLAGLSHAIMLPVPPIYAGKWGDPGLLMPECFVSDDAPPGTLAALIEASEGHLRAAGAELILSSCITGHERRSCLEAGGYEPLTLYLSKSRLTTQTPSAVVCSASEADIEGIVELSAQNRVVLNQLDAFWTPHPQADERFSSWMRRSLTLRDRDMLVCREPHRLAGYVIAQPASRLHFPPAHDISSTGVIDDYFHRQYANPQRVDDAGNDAIALLRGAETAFAARGITSALVVCPAAWTSKIWVLKRAGYTTAITWMIKR
jgi:hypothetical protein